MHTQHGYTPEGDSVGFRVECEISLFATAKQKIYESSSSESDSSIRQKYSYGRVRTAKPVEWLLTSVMTCFSVETNASSCLLCECECVCESEHVCVYVW